MAECDKMAKSMSKLKKLVNTVRNSTLLNEELLKINANLGIDARKLALDVVK